jgi:tetratricopeptide (TPR) repeat protein/predicted Ser/Thr protein kinase
MIGQTISHYRIQSKLGEGGMGVVYAAEDTFLGRRVAIKMLNVEAKEQHHRKRFLREARAISALSHPNIAAVYDYGETPDGIPFIVMELIEGKTLGELLSQRALSLTRAVEIIEEVAGALSEAHHHGIIHRDIKPSNVAISERGEVKVLDFGLAKQLNGDSEPLGQISDEQAFLATKTREGVVIGTPLYLSPEQALGVNVDARSDIFSLGSLLYECIAGRPAFLGKSPVDICARVIRDDPVPPSQLNPNVPPQLDRVTLKSLAKNVDERYQTADELRTDLRSLRDTLSLSGGLRPPYTSLIPEARRTGIQTRWLDILRRPRLLAALFLAATIIPLLLVWGVMRLRHASAPPAEAVRLYNEGTEALFSGAYDRARQALEGAVSVDDKFALAQARLAEALSELDYDDKAKEAMLRADGLLMKDMSSLSPSDTSYIQAIHDSLLGDFEGAAGKYLELAGRSSDRDRMLAYMGAGRAYEKSGLVDKAVDIYVVVTSQNPQSASGFLRLGIIHGRKLSQGEAFEALATAERLYRAQQNAEGVAEVFYQRGYLLNNLRKSAEAREQLQSSLEIARGSGMKSQQIKTLIQLGISFYLDGKLDLAQQYVASAVEQAQAEGIENLVSSGFIDLGNAFFLRGEYERAEGYYKQALDIAARNKGRRAEARAALSLGSLRMSQGKTDAAVDYVERALAFYKQGQYYKETSSALLLLGRAHDYKGEYEAALQTLNQQLLLAQKVGDQAQIAHSHVEIGSSLHHREMYLAALEHFETSYRINKSLGLAMNAGYDQMNRGNLLWQLGRYDEARAALDEAASIAGQQGGANKQLLAWVELFNARLALSRRDFALAKAKSESAYNLSSQQFKDIAAQARYVSGLASALSGTPDAGVSRCNEAVALSQLTGDPRLISYAQLALAESLLETGDGAGAQKTALAAHESFARAGQLDSQWRALLIAALGSRRTGDADSARQYASRADAVLSQLKQSWGPEAFDPYLARPDVQKYREQLNQVLAGES